MTILLPHWIVGAFITEKFRTMHKVMRLSPCSVRKYWCSSGYVNAKSIKDKLDSITLPIKKRFELWTVCTVKDYKVFQS